MPSSDRSPVIAFGRKLGGETGRGNTLGKLQFTELNDRYDNMLGFWLRYTQNNSSIINELLALTKSNDVAKTRDLNTSFIEEHY
jgi:hypothetical protein